MTPDTASSYGAGNKRSWTNTFSFSTTRTLRILSVRRSHLGLAFGLTWPYGKNALDVALLCGLLGFGVVFGAE